MLLDCLCGFIANDDEWPLNENCEISGGQFLFYLLNVRGKFSVGGRLGLLRSLDRTWRWLIRSRIRGRVQMIEQPQPCENQRGHQRDLDFSKHRVAVVLGI